MTYYVQLIVYVKNYEIRKERKVSNVNFTRFKSYQTEDGRWREITDYTDIFQKCKIFSMKLKISLSKFQKFNNLRLQHITCPGMGKIIKSSKL